MPITQLNTADFDYEMMLNVINKSYKGKADITISNYDNTGVSKVQVGSVFEDNGAIFIVDTSEIEPSGYDGISNSTTFYLYYDEDPGAIIYSSTVPTWNDALQGWYNSNDRAFFSMFKDSGGTLYQNKSMLQARTMIQGTKIDTANVDFSTTSSYDIPEIPAGKQHAIFLYRGQNTSGGTVIRSLNLPSVGRYGYSFSVGSGSSNSNIILNQHGADDSTAAGFDFVQSSVLASYYILVIVNYTRLP